MPRISDPALLHPAMREKDAVMEERLASEGIPLKRYETVRTPRRQADLYARGRTNFSTKKVTTSMAWEGRHQYGCAVDRVFLLDGRWVWHADKTRDLDLWERLEGWWHRYHEIAHNIGLETVGSERPHVQLTYPLGLLRKGVYPEGGDASWSNWLEEQIELWGPMRVEVLGLVHPGAPPAADINDRPEISMT